MPRRTLTAIIIALSAFFGLFGPAGASAATVPVQEKCTGEGFTDVSVGICVTSSGVITLSAVGTGTFTFTFNGVQGETLTGENPTYTHPDSVGPGEYTWSVVYQTTSMADPASPDPFVFTVLPTEVTVTVIDPPAAPPVIDDPLVKDDAAYNPTDTNEFSWVVNADRTAIVTILTENTTFANDETTWPYPAPVDVYNPPAPPKRTVDACPKGKSVWIDGLPNKKGQSFPDGFIQRDECVRA